MQAQQPTGPVEIARLNAPLGGRQQPGLSRMWLSGLQVVTSDALPIGVAMPDTLERAGACQMQSRSSIGFEPLRQARTHHRVHERPTHLLALREPLLDETLDEFGIRLQCKLDQRRVPLSVVDDEAEDGCRLQRHTLFGAIAQYPRQAPVPEVLEGGGMSATVNRYPWADGSSACASTHSLNRCTA